MILSDVQSQFISQAPMGFMVFESVRNDSGDIVDFLCVLQNGYAIKQGTQSPMLGKRMLVEMPAHIETGLFNQFTRTVEQQQVIESPEIYYPNLGWFRNTSFPVKGGFGVVFFNIGDLVEKTLRDPLTGLYNRLVLSHLDSEDYSILLSLDLNGFKNINDTAGHDIGDLILKQVAARIKSCVRAECTDRVRDIVIRPGGDEFVILLADGTVRVSEVCDRLIDSIHRSYLIDESRFNEISVSIGVCSIGDEGLARAYTQGDIAMYRSKALFRQHGVSEPVLFEAQMERELKEDLALSRALIKAIKDGALELHYQPIYDIRDPTPSLVAFESLCRWTHEGKPIRPDKFIALAERLHVISRLTSWVLTEAFQQAVEWQQTCDRKINVAVNLSGKDLHDPLVLGCIRHLLDSGSICPSTMLFEITESQMVSPAAMGSLEVIKETGAKLEGDDFGAGYTNLARLFELPIDILKLDRSLVLQFDIPALSDIVSLCHRQGLLVCAEGIEDDETLVKCVASGCDYGQGYYFSRPLPADDAGRLLA
ncbi:MAG: bifunctional diguanylate cyclase/phosphodiesterase [Cyanobacteria bacterium P01_C01_bin.120]